MKTSIIQNLVLLILGTSLLISCSTTEKKEEEKSPENNSKENTFQKVVNQFPVVSLPLQIRIHQHISAEGLQEILPNSSEGKFFQEKTSLYGYGLLPDTSHFYSLIVLYPADVMVPQLFNFSKEGKLISRTTLVAKGCTFECGFRKCTSDCIIDADNQITLVDTNDIYSCDEDGNEILSERNYYLIRNKLKISNNGEIQEISSEREDIISK